MKRCELVLFRGAIKMIEIATNVLLIRVRTPLLDAVLQSKSAIHSTLIHYQRGPRRERGEGQRRRRRDEMRRDDNDTRVDCNVAAATRVNAYESEMKEGERKQNDGEKRRRNGRRYRKHTAYLFSTYVLICRMYVSRYLCCTNTAELIFDGILFPLSQNSGKSLSWKRKFQFTRLIKLR